MTARRRATQVASEVRAVLASLLDVPAVEIEIERGDGPDGPLRVRAIDRTFVVGVLGAATPGPVVRGAERVASAARKLRRAATPLVAAPYMAPAGRRAAEGAGVPWFDLSGNAHIVAPGLRVIVDGRPNRYPVRGRPSSAFAPKSARVARWLLAHPGQAFSQRAIAQATDMTEGFVSRIAARLVSEGYVARERGGALRVQDPALLLDGWRAAYRFERHTVVAGTVAARSGDALTRLVGDTLATAGVPHAATGLSAAWQLQRFAAFRLATFFVGEMPAEDVLARLGFREGTRGANLWLVVPDDAGVFHGAAPRDGVRCVHPVQAYLDLHAHPERAAEAAERLRAELVAGGRHG